MPFDAGSIVAKMKLDKSQFTAGLESNYADFKKFDAAVGAIFRGGLLVGGITYATKKIIDFAEEGAKLRLVDDSFRKISVSAGVSGQAILQMTRAASASLSNRDIESLANQLDLIGVSMSKLPELAKISESIAGRLGRSSKEVLEQLIDGTARASDRMVRLIGINVHFTDGMTEEQKQVAFLNQVLEQGANIIQKLGDNTESTADKMAKGTTAMANWFDALKKQLSGPVGSFLSWLFMPTSGPMSGASIRGLAAELPQTPAAQQFANLITNRSSFMPNSVAEAQAAKVADAAVAAQQAAKRYFDNLIHGGGGAGFGPARKASTGALNRFGELDTGEVNDPGLSIPDSMFKGIKENITATQDLLTGLGDAFAGFFEFLVTDSAKAGAAFFSGIANSVASVMSRMGDMLIYAGIGVESLKFLHGFAAIAAGIALKSISGLFRGIASNNAPITNSLGERSLRQPLTDSSKQGSLSITIEGDFIGDRVWVDRLMEKIRMAQRNYGTSVVVNKVGMAGA